METFEQEIVSLSQKLDALYQVIQKLDYRVSQALSSRAADQSQSRDNYLEIQEPQNYQLKSYITFNSELEHKDILTDGFYPELNRQAGDRQITPDIQIQRLTAQLTAAYNRIAALEEQLLRERIS
jgi:predicted RNase H-like nuclease (RuvC/YqgF family)